MRVFPADVGGFTTMEVWAMTAGINTTPRVGALGRRRPRDHEEIPIGSQVRTPSGRLAMVIAYKGHNRRRGDPKLPTRVWLVCRYEGDSSPNNTVALLPELAVVLRYGPAV